MRLVLTLLLAIGFHFGGTHGAEARGGLSGYSEALEYVATTKLPGNNGAPLALCVLVRTHHGMFVPLWRTQKGYALAENGCNVERFRALDANQLEMFKNAGHIPADTPVTPQVKTGLAVPIWAWVVLAGLVGLAIHKTRQKKSRRAERKQLMGDLSPAAIAILDAMCHAAKADGSISTAEVAAIGHAAQKMTGEAIDPARVAYMAKLAEGQLSDNDFKKFVAGRSDDEKETMMRGVLLVSIADGKLDSKEQQFVGKLGKVMKMPGEKIQMLLQDVVATHTGQAAV